MVGTLMEALCLEGRDNILPAYYETTLKSKYMSDPTSAKMLDLIRSSLSFDFAMIFNTPLDYPFSTVSSGIINGKTGITNSVKASYKIWNRVLQNIYNTYETLE